MTQLSTKLPLKLSTSLDNHSAETTSVFYWHLSFTWAPPAEGVSAARLHSRCSPFSPSTRPRPDAQSLAAVGVFPVTHTSVLLWLPWFHRGLSNRWREEATLISSQQKKKKKHLPLPLFFPRLLSPLLISLFILSAPSFNSLPLFSPPLHVPSSAFLPPP